MKKHKIITISGFVISIILLCFALYGVEFSKLFHILRSADMRFAFIPIACISLSCFLCTYRWSRIAGGTVRFRDTFIALFIGLFLNNVLPARIGEVARGYILSKRTGISFTYALTTVFVDRFFDLVGLLIITFIALRFLPKHSLPYMIWFGIYMLLILLMVCIILLIVLSRKKFAFKISGILTRVNRPFISRLAKRVVEIQENLSRINSPINLVYFIFIAVTMWLLMSTALYFTMLMLGIKIGFIVSAFICALINMSLTIPSSPGYVGYYQGAFCLLLPIFGITKDEALATSLIFQATWYIPYTLLGGILSIKEHLKIKDIQKLEDETEA